MGFQLSRTRRDLPENLKTLDHHQYPAPSHVWSLDLFIRTMFVIFCLYLKRGSLYLPAAQCLTKYVEILSTGALPAEVLLHPILAIMEQQVRILKDGQGFPDGLLHL